MKGSIVRKRDEGYGFIKPEEGDKDVFFHASALVDIDFDSLNEGDMVMFEIEEGPKGPAAANVTKASEEATPATEEATTDPAPEAESEASAEEATE